MKFNQVNLQRASGYQVLMAVVQVLSGSVCIVLLQWRAVTACTCFAL